MTVNNRIVAAVWAAAACLLFSVAASAAAEAPQKPMHGIALVIGQSRYEHLAALPNPANDARAVDRLLGDLGFEVASVSDGDQARLSRALQRFVEDAADADVALLYYSGHGIEAGGENFLVPVEADPGALDDPVRKLVPVSAWIDRLKASVPVAIILLDACRTNPFPPDATVRTASGSQQIAPAGLAVTRGATPLSGSADAPDSLGTVIGFAAAPGRAALDGDPGGNSPYAAALLKHLAAGGFAFGDVMTMVAEEVYVRTGGRQQPWTNASLRRLLYFGFAPEQAEGDEAAIRSERRKLLLTIARTPSDMRSTVEAVAARNDVPLDQLYGMLNVLGVDAGGGDLAAKLDQGAARLKNIMEERGAITRQDPKMMRLASLADSAQSEGAMGLALTFRERASARAGDIDKALDEAESDIRARRLELADTFSANADTAILNFDFATAARRYADAYRQVERYDVARAYGLKVSEGDAWADDSQWRNDNDAARKALSAYDDAFRLGRAAPDARRDAALRGNMAIVMTQLGERTMDPSWLQQAAKLYEAALKAQPRKKLPMDWAYTQLNLGGLYQILGDRAGGADSLRKALKAFQGAAGVMTRDVEPMAWAGLQMNIGNVYYSLGERTGDVRNYALSVEAIEKTLQVWTSENAPRDWAYAQSNLGGSLTTYGARTKNRDLIRRGIEAQKLALSAATMETAPTTWAQAQHNIASSYTELGDLTNDASLYRLAIEALHASRRVYTPEGNLASFVASEYSEGRTLLRLGRLEDSMPSLRDAVTALDIAAAHVDRTQVPVQWARIRSVTGEALLEIGLRAQDRNALTAARSAFKDALNAFREQKLAADSEGFYQKQLATIDQALQK